MDNINDLMMMMQLIGNKETRKYLDLENTAKFINNRAGEDICKIEEKLLDGVKAISIVKDGEEIVFIDNTGSDEPVICRSDVEIVFSYDDDRIQTYETEIIEE